MPRLMRMKNGQFLLTIPRICIRALNAKKGDNIDVTPNLKRGVVELERRNLRKVGN